MTTPDPSRHRDLERLYPGLSDEEYAKAEAFYEKYAALILVIYERLAADPEAMELFLGALPEKAQAEADPSDDEEEPFGFA